MFGRIAKAYKALRLLMAAEKAWEKGLERGEKKMGNTKWGFLIGGIGAVLVTVGTLIRGEITMVEAIPLLIVEIGVVWGIFGGRDALKKIGKS